MNRRTISIALAVAAASVAVTATAYAAGGLKLGPATHSNQLAYKGFYDGHLDTYLLTDVSNKAQAKTWHINYSAPIGGVKGAPGQWFVQGRSAAGQLCVFGSEPGESDYNPLWEEFVVTWKPGVTPVLLKRDDQIHSLQKAGKITVKDLHIVLNAPITRVAK